jgi:hypothetical protein
MYRVDCQKVIQRAGDFHVKKTSRDKKGPRGAFQAGGPPIATIADQKLHRSNRQTKQILCVPVNSADQVVDDVALRF